MPRMYLSPSKTHDLMLLMAPEKTDRWTELHFETLFENKLSIVIPPGWTLPGQTDADNPVPSANSVLLFEGGTDVSPDLYRQKLGPKTQESDTIRDTHEESYYRMAVNSNASMIGVCRGAQFLCVMNGGSLIQHVQGHNKYHDMIVPDKYGARR